MHEWWPISTPGNARRTASIQQLVGGPPDWATLLATAFAFCPANASKSVVMNRLSPHDPSPQPPATEAAPGPIDSSGAVPGDTPNPYAAPLIGDPLPPKKQDENRPAGEIFSPCLRCGCKHAQRIKSWWRYLLEPLLTTHVQCLACGARYNGKRGIWNTIGLLLNWLILIITVLMLLLFDWYPAERPPRAPAPAPPAATSSSSLRWFSATLPGKRVRPALNSRRDLQQNHSAGDGAFTADGNAIVASGGHAVRMLCGRWTSLPNRSGVLG